MSKRRTLSLRALVSCASVILAVSAGGGSSAAQAGAQCGLGTGQKAAGAPIKLGAIVTKQPGTDFTGITGMAQAYFNCVNDNGGSTTPPPPNIFPPPPTPTPTHPPPPPPPL